jgi:glutamate--cysteine ligase catalytic subunit
MEVQMTDFENAAFAIFVVLLSRAILSFNLNFYVPISKVELNHSLHKSIYERIIFYLQVDENMTRAQQRAAVASSKFYFRKNVFPPLGSSSSSTSSSAHSVVPCGDSGLPKETKLRNCFEPLAAPVNLADRGCVHGEYEEMSMNEIINGKVKVAMRNVSFNGLQTLQRRTVSRDFSVW